MTERICLCGHYEMEHDDDGLCECCSCNEFIDNTEDQDD